MKRPTLPALKANISVKLIGFMLVVSVLPLLVFQIISYRAVLQVMTQVTTRHGAQLLANQRDFLIQETDQIDALAENPAWAVELSRLQAATDTSALPDIDKLALQARVGHLLSGYSGLGGLESVDLFTRQGAHFHLGEVRPGSRRPDDLPEGLMARALESPGRTIWYGIQSPGTAGAGSPKVIVSARAIQRVNPSGLGTVPVGLLVMNFSAEYLHDRFNTLDLGAGAYLLLADAQQRLLFHPDARLVGQPLATALRELLRGPSGSVSLRLKGEDVLLNYLQIPDKQWTMFSVVPQATLTAPMLNIERVGVALLLVGLLLIALFVRTYSRQVVQPIRSVSDGFRDFQADRLDPAWRLAKPNAWIQISELVGWFNAFLDTMQARRQSEAALQASEARFRNLTLLSSDWYWEQDAQFRFVRLDGELELDTGITAADHIGRTRWEMPALNMSTADWEAHKALLQAHLPFHDLEMRRPDRDGRVHWVSISGAPIFDDQGQFTGYRGVGTDISQRKQAQAALQASLAEKVALLKEVHHRVKNNLQVITSLLRLEAGRSALPDTRAVLADMQGRIRSMALLHESLYRSGTFAAVDLGAYLTQLATQAFRTQAQHASAVRLELDLASIKVGMDQAAPCGLLVNELISNCLKHGFPNGRSGELRVELHTLEGSPLVRLRVSDSGVGLPADFEARRGQSLGLQLVADLAVQIGGTLDIAPGPGAVFEVIFQADVPEPTASNA